MNEFRTSSNGAQNGAHLSHPSNGRYTLSRVDFEGVARVLGLSIPDGNNLRGPNPFGGKSSENGFVFFFPEGNATERDGDLKYSRKEVLDEAARRGYHVAAPSTDAPKTSGKTFDTRSLEERGLTPDARRFFGISLPKGTEDNWGEYREFPTFHPDGKPGRSRKKFRDPSLQPKTDKNGKPRPQAKTLWCEGTKEQQPPAYGLNYIQPGARVYLVNSELGVWLFWQENLTAICPLGEGRSEATFREIFKAAKANGAAEICSMLDADKTGQSGTEKAQRAALAVGIPFTSKVWPVGVKKGFDVSDFWEECHKQTRNFKIALSELPEVVPASALDNTGGEIPTPTLRNERGAPEYEAGELVRILRPKWNCAALSTQAAHSLRICQIEGENLRFAPALGWLTFNGRHWERDDRHATQTGDRIKALSQAVRDESASLYKLAGELAKSGRSGDAEAMGRAATAHLKHAKQVESKAFIDGALYFAAGDPAIRTRPETFDQRGWLLGFQNGVWDKGEFRVHRREDFLLHLCPVEYDVHADRSEWNAVLERITGGDAEFALTLQDVAGYVLSGASHLRLLPWAYGERGTGKGTFSELLQTLLGDQSAQVGTDELDGDARERLGAKLWNRRLAVCSEAGNKKLDAELLKTLSGGDRLPVRLLYQEAFTTLPHHVLMMVANDPPRMDAYDDALKDRVLALPFVHPLREGEPLKLTGGARLEEVRTNPNSPLVKGFAVWAVEGLKRVWEKQEVFRASCVREATEKFWADTDTLTPFWETLEPNELWRGITKTDLRKRYETWCEDEGARAFNRNQWARACESFGLEEWKDGAGVRHWRQKQLKTAKKDEFTAHTAQLDLISKTLCEEEKGAIEVLENPQSYAVCAVNSTESPGNSVSGSQNSLFLVEPPPLLKSEGVLSEPYHVALGTQTEDEIEVSEF